jgi:hypothetical protein
MVWVFSFPQEDENDYIRLFNVNKWDRIECPGKYCLFVTDINTDVEEIGWIKPDLLHHAKGNTKVFLMDTANTKQGTIEILTDVCNGAAKRIKLVSVWVIWKRLLMHCMKAEMVILSELPQETELESFIWYDICDFMHIKMESEIMTIIKEVDSCRLAIEQVNQKLVEVETKASVLKNQVEKIKK